MTVNDLLAQIAHDADDTSDSFKTASLRWLNLTRSYIASKARWRDAMREDTITTDDRATGLYVLQGYESLVQDVFWDETNEQPVRHESTAQLNSIDPAKETTGPPSWWSDAGTSTDDDRQVYLWPVPDAAYVLRFYGYKTLSDLTSDDYELNKDSFFGKISEWAACFISGMRYYHDLNNNEDPQQMMAQKMMFDKLIQDRRGVNTAAPTSTVALKNVRTNRTTVIGRFDPSSYNNRG